MKKFYKTFFTISFILILSFFIQSCATIIKGTSQDISIQSNPNGANVIVKTKGGVEVFRGTTPTSVKLAKKNEYIVTIQMEGYKETQIYIDQKFEAWALGNLICGGVLGIVIDAVDGAIWKLDPDVIMVTLAKAYLENGSEQLYAVIYSKDKDGQLRHISVPLIKDKEITLSLTK